METQASLVVPGEGDEVTVFASTQNPTLTQVIATGLKSRTHTTVWYIPVVGYVL